MNKSIINLIRYESHQKIEVALMMFYLTFTFLIFCMAWVSIILWWPLALIFYGMGGYYVYKTMLSLKRLGQVGKLIARDYGVINWKEIYDTDFKVKVVVE